MDNGISASDVSSVFVSVSDAIVYTSSIGSSRDCGNCVNCDFGSCPTQLQDGI